MHRNFSKSEKKMGKGGKRGEKGGKGGERGKRGEKGRKEKKRGGGEGSILSTGEKQRRGKGEKRGKGGKEELYLNFLNSTIFHILHRILLLSDFEHNFPNHT